MTTATVAHPRGSLHGTVVGRTPPRVSPARPPGDNNLPAGNNLPTGNDLPAGNDLPTGDGLPTGNGLAAGPVERSRAVRRWLPRIAVAAVLVLFAVELAVGWPSLAAALARLRAPQPGWLAAGLALEIASMGAYARMQRHLLRSAGVRAPLRRHLALAYAAHSLSVTLPGGAAFSTRLNFRQMRRFGASPAVASWAIALSAILSAAAFAVLSAVSAVAANGTPQWRTLAGLILAGLLLMLGVRWITARPGRIEPAAGAALARVNRLLRRPREQGLDQVRGFAEQLRAARLTPGHGAAAAAFAVLNWLLDALALWMCLRAVSDSPPIGSQVLLAFCAAMATGSITILPGGLGIIDSALIVALVAGGTASATAIAAVVLYRILTLGFIVGAGWLAWLAVRSTAQGPSAAQPDPTAAAQPDSTATRAGTALRRDGVGARCPVGRRAGRAPRRARARTR